MWKHGSHLMSLVSQRPHRIRDKSFFGVGYALGLYTSDQGPERKHFFLDLRVQVNPDECRGVSRGISIQVRRMVPGFLGPSRHRMSACPSQLNWHLQSWWGGLVNTGWIWNSRFTSSPASCSEPSCPRCWTNLFRLDTTCTSTSPFPCSPVF